MMQNVNVKSNSRIVTAKAAFKTEYSFQQQTAFKYNEETLRLKHRFWKALKPGLFGNQNRNTIHRTFGNMALRKLS